MSVLYSFDPDQTPHSVDPDLGRNYLQMLSADIQQNEKKSYMRFYSNERNMRFLR